MFPLQKKRKKNIREADDPIYINTIKSIRINKVVINKEPNGWGEGVGNDFGYLLLEGNLSTRIDPQGEGSNHHQSHQNLRGLGKMGRGQ